MGLIINYYTISPLIQTPRYTAAQRGANYNINTCTNIYGGTIENRREATKSLDTREFINWDRESLGLTGQTVIE